jgi:hypothetical protein
MSEEWMSTPTRLRPGNLSHFTTWSRLGPYLVLKELRYQRPGSSVARKSVPVTRIWLV